MRSPSTTENLEPQRKSQVGFGGFLRSFIKHKLSVIGIVIIVILFGMAIFAPWLAPYPPNEPDFFNVLKGPSRAHWLGTDDLGRDLLSRVIYGARVSMTVGIGVTVFSLILAALPLSPRR